MNWYSRERAPLRRVRLVVQRLAALRPRPAAHRHDLQHERRAPARRRADGLRALDDAGVRTAGTTYLMYRGRHRAPGRRGHRAHAPGLDRVRAAPVMGPHELFYADIFASRETGCRSQLGLPGVRDQHAGCVGAYLVEHDLFDFLLLSLPDNDTHSHRTGPHAQVDLDRRRRPPARARCSHAGGGTDAFLDEHAVIVVADHSHALVEQRDRPAARLRRASSVLAPSGAAAAASAEIALCPAQRSRDGLRARPRGPRRARAARRRASRSGSTASTS